MMTKAHIRIMLIPLVVAIFAFLQAGCAERGTGPRIVDVVSHFLSDGIPVENLDAGSVKHEGLPMFLSAYLYESLPPLESPPIMKYRLKEISKISKREAGISGMQTFSVASIPVTIIRFRNENAARVYYARLEAFISKFDRMIKEGQRSIMELDAKVQEMFPPGTDYDMIEELTELRKLRDEVGWLSCAYQKKLVIVVHHSRVKKEGKHTTIIPNYNSSSIRTWIHRILGSFNSFKG